MQIKRRKHHSNICLKDVPRTDTQKIEKNKQEIEESKKRIEHLKSRIHKTNEESKIIEFNNYLNELRKSIKLHGEVNGETVWTKGFDEIFKENELQRMLADFGISQNRSASVFSKIIPLLIFTILLKITKGFLMLEIAAFKMHRAIS